jgi:hypothetical protein
VADLQGGELVVARYRLDARAPSDLVGIEAWDATDQILDRPVRLSIITSPDAPLTLDAARRAALVSDEHVTRVIDVLHDATRSIVVTEPYVGSTLADLVEAQPLSPHAARAVVGAAATALEAARRRGVHHGALRPSAIRVHQGRVRVTGLGIDGDLVHGEARLDGDAASRADTVALVALLHYALTGDLPRVAHDVEALDPAVAGPARLQAPGAPLVPPRDVDQAVPRDLDTLCSVTLGDHDDGPVTPGQLVSELAPWDSEHVPVTGEVPVAVQPIEPPATREVTRQSVRTLAAGGASRGAARPGTPPPAGPVRRPSTGRIPRVAPAAAAAGATTLSLGPAAAPAATAGPAGAAPTATKPLSTQPVTTQPAAAPAAMLSEPGPPGRGPGGPGTTTARPADDGARPQTTKSGRRLRLNPTPYVLALMLVLVVGAGLVAKNTLFSGFEPAVVEASQTPTDEAPADADPAAEPPAEEAPAEAPPAPTLPVISGGQVVTNPGDEDYNENAGLAIDDDVTTAWYSLEYKTSNFGGFDRLLAYAITLEQPATVSTVYLSTQNTGGNVEIRATDAANPRGGEVLASGPLNGETTMTLSAPVETQNLVILFTDLPTATSDGKFRAHIYDISLS